MPALLANSFSPLANPPQIVVAALKALTDIADAAALATPSSCIDIPLLADSVFVPQHIESLNAMLSITSPKHLLQSQVMLAAGLICRLCREERHQHALATAGVLDSLATQLSRFAVRDGLVVPGAEELAYSDGLYEVFPEPVAASASIGPILEAIAAVLGDSKYRANRLAYSPALLAIFPAVKFDSTKRPPSQPHAVTAMEFILPAMPVNPSRGQAAAHSSLPSPVLAESQTPSRTSLSMFGSAAIWDSSRAQSLGNDDGAGAEEVESPLIPWLIHLARTLGEYNRLMAVSVLAPLFKAGLGRKSVRETSIGLLVVPLLVAMVAKNDKEGPEADGPTVATRRLILERAPAVLARLITDSEYLQKSAFDCDAVKILTKLLKRAYQPVPSLEQPKYWSPLPDAAAEAESTSASAQLGGRGQNPLLAHRLRLRDASLKAIGALSAGNEDYRKALMAEDLVPYVVESLCEWPRKPRQAKERPKERPGAEPARRGPSPAYGTNPVGVLIAGCHVVRMLARSVSILRTSLSDYDVSDPIFHFLTHRDVNVQIAATATVINLLVEVSPAREVRAHVVRRDDDRANPRQQLTKNGVMRILCDHAHSDNPVLRLNALWALKHFVDAVGPELKKACLGQLKPGWLVQLVSDDGHDAALQDSRSKEAAEDDADEDVDMQISDQPFRWLYGSNGSMRELDVSRSSRLRQAEDRLSAIRETELNPVRRARSDVVAIQEQGFSFIRNLIGRPEEGPSSETPSETTEMIDHLLGELGQERLFEIMAAKLRTKPLHLFARHTWAPGREQPCVLPPQPRIVAAVIYILVHMAASIPRHRQLVMAQADLLRLLGHQAGSNDSEVRVALCWLVINLTCHEEEAEAHQCLARVNELKRLGFDSKMEILAQDCDLDVRQRATTAVWQIEHAPY